MIIYRYQFGLLIIIILVIIGGSFVSTIPSFLISLFLHRLFPTHMSSSSGIIIHIAAMFLTPIACVLYFFYFLLKSKKKRINNSRRVVFLSYT